MRKKVEYYLHNVVDFFIVLLVGYSVAKEVEKQIPPELRIDRRRIILEALVFSLIVGVLAYIVSSIILAG